MGLIEELDYHRGICVCDRTRLKYRAVWNYPYFRKTSGDLGLGIFSLWVMGSDSNHVSKIGRV
jgi:hypothetical protein